MRATRSVRVGHVGRLLARSALAACALAATMAAATPARAFCRTTTRSVAPDFQPTRDRCWDQGVPLFWKNACVGYSINRFASKQVSYEDAANGIARAFTRWTGASCPTDGSGNARVSIDVRDMGPVECDRVKYNQEFGNQNVIVFRDDKWDKNDSSNTLALTTVTFNPDTGEIYDADMEVNTHEHRVTLQDPVPSDGYDFASILTHETGHFLGLAHSGDSRATMFASYQPGQTAMRNLTQDDVTGICTVYRPDGSRLVLEGKATSGDSCDPTPRHGFARECAPPAKTGCFSVTGATTSGSAAGVLALLPVIALAVRRRRS